MEESDSPVEQLLRRFRPIGPPASLRERALSAARLGIQSRSMRPWAVLAFRTAVAATLILAVSLSLAAERAMTKVAANIGMGPAVWTEQAEEAAEMLNGSDWGRRYIALGLMASTGSDADMQSGVLGRDVQ